MLSVRPYKSFLFKTIYIYIYKYLDFSNSSLLKKLNCPYPIVVEVQRYYSISRFQLTFGVSWLTTIWIRWYEFPNVLHLEILFSLYSVSRLRHNSSIKVPSFTATVVDVDNSNNIFGLVSKITAVADVIESSAFKRTYPHYMRLFDRCS